MIIKKMRTKKNIEMKSIFWGSPLPTLTKKSISFFLFFFRLLSGWIPDKFPKYERENLQRITGYDEMKRC